jgi:hypothetical protein
VSLLLVNHEYSRALIMICHHRHVRTHVSHSGKATHNHPKYKKEKHSLQGKHGKTHAVC